MTLVINSLPSIDLKHFDKYSEILGLIFDHLFN